MSNHYLTPEELIREVNKEFGPNTLVPASKAAGLVKRRISTGSFALDLILGGGYPEGAITLLEGESQSSKSWTMNTMARNFLTTYPEGIYILVNAEGTNDPHFLAMLGVDLDRTYFLQPDSGEQAWDASVKVASLAKKVFIGVDSLDACTPMSEIKDDIADHHMAPAARLNNKGFRKLVAAMKTDITTDDSRVTAVFITQLRDNIGVMFGDKKISVGGKGKKFAAMTILRMAAIAQLRHDTGDKNLNKYTYGLTIEASIVKNKGCGAGDKVKFDLYKENYNGFRRGDIDNATELIPYLLQFGVASKSGTKLSYQGEVYSEKDFCERVKSDVDFLSDVLGRLSAEHSKRYSLPDAPVSADPTEDTESEPEPAKSTKKRTAAPPMRLPPKSKRAK